MLKSLEKSWWHFEWDLFFFIWCKNGPKFITFTFEIRKIKLNSRARGVFNSHLCRRYNPTFFFIFKTEALEHLHYYSILPVRIILFPSTFPLITSPDPRISHFIRPDSLQPNRAKIRWPETENPLYGGFVLEMKK